MAIITGYTAEKMEEFSDASVVSGTVNTAGSLILTTRGGEQIDAGNVKGDKGDTGSITTEQLAPYVATWKSGTAYKVGDRITLPAPWNGIATCIQDHTSSISLSSDIVARWDIPILMGTTAQRATLFVPPQGDGGAVALANKKVRYFNTVNNWWESYYSIPRDGLTVAPLISGNASGWYPDAGSDLRCHAGMIGGIQTITAARDTSPTLPAFIHNTKNRFTKGEYTFEIRIPVGGYYRILATIYYSGPASPTINAAVRLNGGSTTIAHGSSTKPNANDSTVSASNVYPLKADDVVSLVGYASQATNMWGTTGYNGTRIGLEYAGPPLADFNS